MSEENTDLEVHEFELIIGDAGGVIDNGDVPIRWCLTPNYVKQLERDGIIDPHILLSSFAPDASGDYTIEMDRKLVPLSELMTYLRFYRAGTMKVWGLILDAHGVGRDKLRDTYIRKLDGEYRNSFVRTYSDGSIFEDSPYMYAHTSELVEIPADVFGKEPSPWVKWYVNLWHNARHAAVDECDFRRRMMIAFGVKWMAFIPWLIMLVYARVLFSSFWLSLGYLKSVYFFRSFRPYKYPSFKSLIDYPLSAFGDNSFLFQRRSFMPSYKGETELVICGFAFAPIFVIIAIVVAYLLEANGLIGYIVITGGILLTFAALLAFLDLCAILVELSVSHHTGDKMSSAIRNAFLFLIHGDRRKYWLYALIAVTVAVLAYAIAQVLPHIGVLGVLGAIIIGSMVGAIIFSEALLRLIDKLMTLSPEDNDYSKVASLLCPDEEDNLRPNINFIPKKQQTLRLKFLDFKNKVCKPMQR
jgi:hypothetical protein